MASDIPENEQEGQARWKPEPFGNSLGIDSPLLSLWFEVSHEVQHTLNGRGFYEDMDFRRKEFVYLNRILAFMSKALQLVQPLVLSLRKCWITFSMLILWIWACAPF